MLIGTVVLSFFAALGIGFLVSDYIFGFPGRPSLPLYVFVFLVALGIDYNIFPDGPGARGNRDPRHQGRHAAGPRGDRRGDYIGRHRAGRNVLGAGRAAARLPWPRWASPSPSACCSTRSWSVRFWSRPLTLDIGLKIWPSALAEVGMTRFRKTGRAGPGRRPV